MVLCNLELDGREHLESRGFCLSFYHLHCLWNASDPSYAHGLFFLFLFLSFQEFSVTSWMFY